MMFYNIRLSIIRVGFTEAFSSSDFAVLWIFRKRKNNWTVYGGKQHSQKVCNKSLCLLIFFYKPQQLRADVKFYSITVRTINDQDSVKFLANSFSLCSYFSIPDYFSIQCSSLHTGNFIVPKQLWSKWQTWPTWPSSWVWMELCSFLVLLLSVSGRTQRISVPVSYTHLTLPTNREV